MFRRDRLLRLLRLRELRRTLRERLLLRDLLRTLRERLLLRDLRRTLRERLLLRDLRDRDRAIFTYSQQKNSQLKFLLINRPTLSLHCLLHRNEACRRPLKRIL